MFNRVVLIGRLTRDPEMRYTPQGHAVANFTLAVDRPFKNGQGERQADFIDVAAWRKLGELVGQYMHKGRMVAVEGRLEIRSYEDKQGTRRKAATIVADGVRFIDKKDSNGAAKAEPAPDAEF